MSEDRSDRSDRSAAVEPKPPIAGGSQQAPTTPRSAGSQEPAPRLGPAANWQTEPGLDTARPVLPDDEIRYIEQWRVYFRTDQTTYNAWVHTAHPMEPDWARLTKAQYLAALPFPGPRSFNEVADKAAETVKKPAETWWPRHAPWD